MVPAMVFLPQEISFADYPLSSEEPLVEQFQLISDCQIQFGKGEELFIPKSCCDPSRNISYCPLSIRLIFGALTRAGIIAVP